MIIEPLSNRARLVLERLFTGEPYANIDPHKSFTRDEVNERLQENPRELYRIHGAGRKTVNEILTWAGIDKNRCDSCGNSEVKTNHITNHTRNLRASLAALIEAWDSYGPGGHFNDALAAGRVALRSSGWETK